MPKAKTVNINEGKPSVDLDELDRLAAEEEAKADKIAKNAENGEDSEPENKQKPLKTAPKPEVDYETKYKESQKEALVLKSQLDKIEEEKNKKIEITDEYLTNKYQDWADMTSGEQRAIKKAEELEQEVQEIRNNANQYNNDRKWQEKVETFVENDLADLFPKIVGKEEEFKRFATRPSRKGLPLEDLAKIYLFENPTTEPKRSLFHNNGSAGATPPPADEGMSADEARLLRITRPSEYMRLVRAGKIKIKI